MIVDPARQLAEYIELFKNHAARLSQVASSAAVSSQDARRESHCTVSVDSRTSSYCGGCIGVQIIRVTASELDKLTPQIVSAAVAVRRNTEDSAAREHLEMLRKEWASKVQLLTTAIDEITDKGDFMAAAGWDVVESVVIAMERRVLMDEWVDGCWMRRWVGEWMGG